jgi:hypothetical protein
VTAKLLAANWAKQKKKVVIGQHTLGLGVPGLAAKSRAVLQLDSAVAAAPRGEVEGPDEGMPVSAKKPNDELDWGRCWKYCSVFV